MEDQKPNINEPKLSLLENIKKHFEDPANVESARAYFAAIRLKEDIADRQALQLIERFKDNQEAFAELVQKIHAKYDSDAYVRRHYGRGCEPPEALYYFLYNAAELKGEEISEEDAWKHGGMFIAGGYKLFGHVMTLYQGQGSFVKVESEEEFYGKYYDMNVGKYGEWLDSKTNQPIYRTHSEEQTDFKDIKLEHVEVKQMDPIPGFDGFTEADKDRALGA